LTLTKKCHRPRCGRNDEIGPIKKTPDREGRKKEGASSEPCTYPKPNWDRGLQREGVQCYQEGEGGQGKKIPETR